MSASGPMWEQILTDLRGRLARGEFDSRFPTDRELVAEYGVSRHTVREAVRRLQDEGLVVRRRGVGSVRARPPFEQPVRTLYSLFSSIEATGVPQTSHVLAQEVRVDEVAAKVLGLAPDGRMFHLERIRLAGDEPLAHDRVWMPMPLAAPLLSADFGRTALYDELAARCGLVPDEGSEQIRPIRPGRETRARLGIPADQPAFEIDRRTRAGGSPIEWRVTIVRGDRFSLRVDWDPPNRPAESPLLREPAGQDRTPWPVVGVRTSSTRGSSRT